MYAHHDPQIGMLINTIAGQRIENHVRISDLMQDPIHAQNWYAMVFQPWPWEGNVNPPDPDKGYYFRVSLWRSDQSNQSNYTIVSMSTDKDK